MNLIKSSYEIWDQSPRFEGMLEHIERAGRVCYKSEGNIKYDECGNSLTAEPFVQKMIKSGHGAMLEHGTVYLAMPVETIIPIEANGWGKYTKTPYSKGYKICSIDGEKRVAVTTNYRVLVENNWLDDLKYLCEPTEYHEKRITVHFVCDRGVSHEFVRHRVFSFAQESTRYCNYSNDKFGNEITFIIPCWLGWDEQNIHYGDFEKSGSGSIDSGLFINSLLDAEDYYLCLLKEGWKPQQARAVLPNALKTELVMTGFVDDWKHFFELRCASNAHPQARELAIPLHEEFIRRGWL